VEWSPAGAAFTQLIMRTFPLERRLSAAGEAIARSGGQTLARWLVLEAIDGAPASVADVGRSLGLARQGVQRLADLLVADGLAGYEDNPRHARAKLLVITDAGRDTLHTIRRAQRTWANRLGEQLGEEPLAEAGAVLDRLLAAVVADMPAGHTEPATEPAGADT
jgi:DNA-binding MarR family transcriptional regulator